MELLTELAFDLGVFFVVLDVFLVTACISTIIFILTKNQYVSYLSASPIFYIFSWIGHGFTHFILLVLAMTIQAGIILLMNRQRNKQLLLNAPKDDLQ